jgi:hypothetical protein
MSETCDGARSHAKIALRILSASASACIEDRQSGGGVDAVVISARDSIIRS